MDGACASILRDNTFQRKLLRLWLNVNVQHLELIDYSDCFIIEVMWTYQNNALRSTSSINHFDV